MRLPVIYYPNPLLSQPSVPVTEFDTQLDELVKNMIDTCKATDNCVGLAAVQVGILKRLSILKLGNKYIHIINPEILYQSGEATYDWEGCMSVGEGKDQLFAKIGRDRRITVRYMTKDKKEVVRQCEGFTAHLFQHEIDHMNGHLFLKYVKSPEHIWKDADLDEYIRKYNKLPQ